MSAENGVMLGRYGDEMPPMTLARLGNAFDRQVQRLGRAARKRDTGRLGAEELCYLFARLIDRLVGHPSVGVPPGRRVAEVLAEPRPHLREHLFTDSRVVVVIEIDRRRHVRAIYSTPSLSSCL